MNIPKQWLIKVANAGLILLAAIGCNPAGPQVASTRPAIDVIVSAEGQPDVILKDISVKLTYTVDWLPLGTPTNQYYIQVDTIDVVPFLIWREDIGHYWGQVDIPLSAMKSLFIYGQYDGRAEATFITQGHEETLTGQAYSLHKDGRVLMEGTSDPATEQFDLMTAPYTFGSSTVTITFQHTGNLGTKSGKLATEGECITWTAERYPLLEHDLDALVVTEPANQESVYSWDQIKSIRYEKDPWKVQEEQLGVWPTEQALVVTLRDGRTVTGMSLLQLNDVTCVRPDGMLLYFRLCDLQELSLD